MAVAHYVSMFVMSAGSFVFGILPMSFTLRAARIHPFFLSLILCLGAGVLLATSIVHMLTEVQEKLQFSAQLYFSAGFLILYAFDEISHFCLEGKRPPNPNVNVVPSRRSSYGTTNSFLSTENSPLLETRDLITEAENDIGYKSQNRLRCKNIAANQTASGTYSHSNNSCEDQIQCHIEIGEPCSSNPIAKAGLLIALTTHSILEGIAIGVQTEFDEILLIMGTITFHKIVLSFCLGLELFSYGFKTLYLIMGILLFSIGSSIGILIGMFVTSSNGIFNVDVQMQAIAAGSLLYIAAFEVLPRERFRWQHKSNQHAAGIIQLLFVFIGFICITLVHIYLVHPYHQASSVNNPMIHYNDTEEASS